MRINMIKINRTPKVPASLEKKSGDCYRAADVVWQLHQDFYGKCYLCEMDKLQSVEVEHLKAHHGNKDLKYEWKNLFYSCAHCNSVKNKGEYEKNIIDCCNTEPEKMLEHTMIDGKVCVKSLVQDESALLTAKLITECFEKRNTGIRELECQVRVDELKKTMNTLYKLLDKYQVNIDTCLSGTDAIEILKDNNYNLILLDDMMPKLSGKDTLKELKKNKDFKTPVVVLTANAISGMKEKYIDLGFDDYLAKPIDKEELNKILNKFL